MYGLLQLSQFALSSVLSVGNDVVCDEVDEVRDEIRDEVFLFLSRFFLLAALSVSAFSIFSSTSSLVSISPAQLNSTCHRFCAL